MMITANDDAFSEATWNEIGRRSAASDAGTVEHIPGDAALAQVRADLERRWNEITSGSVPCRVALEVLNEIEARLRERTAGAS